MTTVDTARIPNKKREIAVSNGDNMRKLQCEVDSHKLAAVRKWAKIHTHGGIWFTMLVCSFGSKIMYVNQNDNLQGFPKGACVGEQSRISLPNAQYTNGDFIIVQKLVRILPKGQQMKREVDCILDEVFDTMTPMHFHLREIIFVTYNKIRKSRTEDERQMLQKLSIDYLERYIYLIIFNTYLHFDYNIQWKRPFSHWMKQVAAKSGVYELLDNLGFYDFELPLETFRTMSGRWKARVPEMQFQGEFL